MKDEETWASLWHTFFKPILIGSALITVAAWIVGVSFWLFPWESSMEWWYIPHVVTTLVLAFWPLVLGASMLATIGNEDEKK